MKKNFKLLDKKYGSKTYWLKLFKIVYMIFRMKYIQEYHLSYFQISND